jgi:hypothetical protein
VRTVRSVAYDILREILREARQFNPREFRVVAAPQVIELLLDEESTHLAGLSDFIRKPISLQAEASMGARAVRHRAVVALLRQARRPVLRSGAETLLHNLHARSTYAAGAGLRHTARSFRSAP